MRSWTVLCCARGAVCLTQHQRVGVAELEAGADARLCGTSLLPSSLPAVGNAENFRPVAGSGVGADDSSARVSIQLHSSSIATPALRDDSGMRALGTRVRRCGVGSARSGTHARTGEARRRHRRSQTRARCPRAASACPISSGLATNALLGTRSIQATPRRAQRRCTRQQARRVLH